MSFNKWTVKLTQVHIILFYTFILLLYYISLNVPYHLQYTSHLIIHQLFYLFCNYIINYNILLLLLLRYMVIHNNYYYLLMLLYNDYIIYLNKMSLKHLHYILYYNYILSHYYFLHIYIFFNFYDIMIDIIQMDLTAGFSFHFYILN